MYKLIVTIIFVAVLAQPAGASTSAGSSQEHEVPVIFDAFILRPLGLAATIAGAAMWTAATPILALRPTEMHKSFKSMVINPSRFVFVDPLGYHPARLESQRAGEVE